MGAALAPVDLGTEGGGAGGPTGAGAAGSSMALRAVWLAAGDQHTCAVLQPGGRAKCWGERGACGAGRAWGARKTRAWGVLWRCGA